MLVYVIHTLFNDCLYINTKPSCERLGGGTWRPCMSHVQLEMVNCVLDYLKSNALGLFLEDE
jgi:hypothetical protein